MQGVEVFAVDVAGLIWGIRGFRVLSWGSTVHAGIGVHLDGSRHKSLCLLPFRGL